MVEKSESVYDKSSASTPLVTADYLIEEKEPTVVSMPETATNCKSVDFDVKSKGDDDSENIRVAGIGSAVIGLIVGGPILAAIFGFGAVYAAERNEKVRNKFGDAWSSMKEFDRKHNVIKHGVNSIGKGTVWLIEKITGKDNNNNNNHKSDTIDSWVASQPEVNAK
jgi:hypothetical protein